MYSWLEDNIKNDFVDLDKSIDGGLVKGNVCLVPVK